MRGFTLIELMITVAIVGVLTAIAYPSYTNYIKNTNRKAAIAEMNQVIQQLERYFTTNNGTYTGATPDISPHIKGYTITNVIAADGLSYTVNAATKSTELHDEDCGNLSIDSFGTQIARGPQPSSCF
ncbi:MAG: pilus assembly protein PilE [Gammaproteobacteria bacterium]|nr:MAG: pilus assembly protein PilE [Gammaproteobacteria bacterium]